MRSLHCFLIAACLGSCAVLSASSCTAELQDASGAPGKEQTLSLEQRVENALRFPVSAEFDEQPLVDAVAMFQELTGMEITIDARALDEVGLSVDHPVTCHFSPQKKLLSLESVLNHILYPIDLTWVVRHETLTITTPEEAENELEVRVFPVSDLIVVHDEKRGASYDYHSLIEVITSVIEPDSWDEVGGAGTITPAYGAFVVSQTRQTNDRIDELLAAIRQLKKSYQEASTFSASVIVEPERNATARAALRTRVSLDVIESPLSDVTLFLSETVKVPILLDTRSLDDVGMPSDTPVTSHLSNQTLTIALSRFLHSLDLTWRISDEAIIITTQESNETQLETRIYPVRDLIDGKAPEQIGTSFDDLVSVATSNVAPDTWDDVGGPGTIEILTRPETLIVSQTPDVHEKLDDLFIKLRVAHQEEQENSVIADQPFRPIVSRRVYHLATPKNGQPVSASRLVELIPRVLGEDGWKRSDQAQLEYVEGAIIVQHDQATHRRVQQLLNELGIVSHMAGGMGGGGLRGGGFFRVEQ
jgi:hypothetical protein